MVAIAGHLRFSPADFKHFRDELGLEHWASWEGIYREACAAGNLSACRAVEDCLGRPPFIFDGYRLALGSQFHWAGRRVTVTSFGKDHNGPYIGLCAYKPDQGSRKVVDKLFKVHRDELKEGQPKKDKPKVERLLMRFLELGLFGASYYRKEWSVHRDFVSFWGKWSEVWWMKELLAAVDYPISLHQANGLTNADEVRMFVGDFETKLRPLLEPYVDKAYREHRTARRTERAEKTKEKTVGAHS